MIQFPFGESPFHGLKIGELGMKVSIPSIGDQSFGQQLLVLVHEQIFAPVNADEHVEHIGRLAEQTTFF